MARADGRRRRRDAVRVLARLAPGAAALAFVLAIASRLAGWSGAWPMGLGGLILAALAAYVLVRGRRRATTDAIAARVDDDATLHGELRSAHWFASAPARDAWAAYHVDQAATRTDGVDWASLYPPVRAARSWIVAGVLAAAALGVNIGVPGLVPAPLSEMLAGRAAAADRLSDDLQKKLDALLAAMEEGRLSAADTKAALDQMKDLMAKVDPALQKKIDEMIKNGQLGKDAATKRTDLDAETLAERGERDKASSGGLPEDIRWALEDLASKLANASAERQTAKGNPSASSETGEKGKGSAQAETSQASAAEAAMQMVREAASDAAAAKMMMGGGGMMGGDSRSGAGGNEGKETGAADALLIAQALRKETVEASADMLGANVNKEDIRRKTEQSTSTLGYTRVQAPAAFERGRADAPPPVPEARRDLLLKYFIRR